MAKVGQIKGFLPPQYHSKTAPSVTQCGVWETNKDDAFLDLLVHSMPTGTNLHLADLVSLPHIWGQTVAFTIAWQSPNHPMFETVRGEWRGLLALIGLAGWEDLPVSVIGVDLSDLSERPFVTSTEPLPQSGSVRGGKQLANFPKIARHYLPEGVVVGAPEWRDSAVILYDRNAISRPERSSNARPVGFCAPRSLVVPARNYRGVLDERISWRSDDGRGYPLRDPLNSNGQCMLSRIQREVLWHYIGEVKAGVVESVKNLQGGSTYDSGYLLGMLESYQRDIERCRDTQHMRLPDKSELLGGWDSERFRGFGSPYFDALASIPARPKERFPKETMIPCSVEGINRFNGVILFGYSLVRQPGVSARDVLVWGAHTLHDLGDEPIHYIRPHGSSVPSQHRQAQLAAQSRIRKQVQAETKAAGYLLLHVEELFYPEILKTTMHPEGHGTAWDGWLPPLRPLALALFSPDYLHDNLMIDDIGGEVRVSIRLDGLSDMIGVGLGARIDRVYKKAQCIAQAPAVLALWPDFESADWHKYGVFHLRDSEKEVNISAVPATGEWLPAFVDHWDNSDTIVDFFDKLETDPRFVDYVSGKEDQIAYSTHWFRKRPEILIASAVGVPVSRNGIIILPRDQNIRANGRGAVIGLDVGSTNTAAAWFLPGVNHRDESQRQVSFEPMLRFIFRGNNNEHCIRMEEMFGFHAPIHPTSPQGSRQFVQKTPYLSLLKERKDHGHVGIGLPNVHYRIPWPMINRRDLAALNLNPTSSDTYICDLKWAQRKRGTDIYLEAIEQYLTLVMRLIGAAVVRHGLSLVMTEWRFSYPDTFTTAEIDSFYEIVRRLTGDLNNQSQRSHNRGQGLARIGARKECLCLCDYFMLRPSAVPRSNTAVIFDVGGHNTDVVIWHRGEIKWNCTLAFASQNTLVEFMMNSSNLLNSIFPTEWSDYHKITTSPHIDKPFRRMITELLIQDEVFSEWQVRASAPQKDHSDIAQLRNMATFALAGLLYYTAMAMATQMEANSSATPSNPFPSDLISLQICFGGKGSLLFKNFIDRPLHSTLSTWFGTQVNNFRKKLNPSYDACPSSTIPAPSDKTTQSERWVMLPILFNDAAKHEVSEGLLIQNSPQNFSSPTIRKDNDKDDAVGPVDRAPLYIGEKISKAGVEGVNQNSEAGGKNFKKFNDFLSCGDLEKTVAWEIRDLDHFKEFLKEFKKFEIPITSRASDSEIKDDDLIRKIIGRVRNDFDRECRYAQDDGRRNKRNGDSRTYQPQPVFILALRHATSILNGCDL